MTGHLLGAAGAIEAARVLSKYSFENSIVYVGLSGEEQGLYGGKVLAQYALNNKWKIIGLLNNDMIGNIEGIFYLKLILIMFLYVRSYSD